MNKVLATSRRYLPEWLGLLLLTLIYALHLGNVGIESPEELQRLLVARGDFQAMAAYKNPLLLFLIKLGYVISGEGSLAAGRSAGLGLLLAGLVGTYMWLLLTLKNRVAALLGTLMLGTCWGVFRFGMMITVDAALMALLVWVPVVLHAAAVLSGRRRVDNREVHLISIPAALVMGLLFLAGGIWGVLAGVLLAVAVGMFYEGGVLIWRRIIAWRVFACVLLLLAVPGLWAIGVFIDYPASLLAWLAQLLTPSFRFQPDIAEKLWGLAFGLAPFIFFLALFPLEFIIASRKFRVSLDRMMPDAASKVAMAWLAVGLLAYLLGPVRLSGYLFLLPPVAMFAGTWLAFYQQEGNEVSSMFELACDATTGLLMVLAVIISVFLFQTLPDQYPLAFWELPGPAVLPQIAGFTLPEPFPVWKLWLIPGVVILLAAGVILLALILGRRFRLVGVSLILVWSLFLVYIKLVFLPVLAWPVTEAVARRLNERADRAVMVLVDTSRPDLRELLFRLDRKTAPVRPVTPGQLDQVLSQPEEEKLYAVLSETAYYRLSPGNRRKLRVISDYRDWAYFRPRLFLASFRKQAHYYDGLTYRILLVETLPGL